MPKTLLVSIKGGPSSGNYGHAGRPGLVGGSGGSGVTGGGSVVEPTKKPGTGSLTPEQIAASKAYYQAKAETKKNQLYYHGTTADLIDSITAHGLLPNKSEEDPRPAAVFMSSSRTEVLNYLEENYGNELHGGESVAIFAFRVQDSRQLHADKIDIEAFGAYNSYYTKKAIPPEWLESVEIITPGAETVIRRLKEHDFKTGDLLYVPIIVTGD